MGYSLIAVLRTPINLKPIAKSLMAAGTDAKYESATTILSLYPHG